MKANIPKGMGGGPGNMQAMLRQAQKMQEDAQRVQAELEGTEYTASAGGGAVSATVNGKHELTALTISPDVVDPDDAEMLADLVMAAINEANRNASKDAEAKMGAVTGGMNLPGMF
ncbi:MAG: YbaB/EbfC family nucleoid-associated protein [Clostridia bacterium]|nr:YbaB/EbfC family nucleoid-associated protein [Clostridia bacterium]